MRAVEFTLDPLSEGAAKAIEEMVEATVNQDVVESYQGGDIMRLWGVWHPGKERWWWTGIDPPYMTTSHKEACMTCQHVRAGGAWSKAEDAHEWTVAEVGDDGLPMEEVDDQIRLEEQERTLLDAVLVWDGEPQNPMAAYDFRHAMSAYCEAIAEVHRAAWAAEEGTDD